MPWLAVRRRLCIAPHMHDARLLSPEFALHQPHERGAEVRSRPRPQRRVESKVGLPTLDRHSEHDRIASIPGFATDPIDGETYTRTVRQPSDPFALSHRAAFVSKTPALATEKPAFIPSTRYFAAAG